MRPGKPNKAASTFASSILREPLAGQDAICPVERSALMWILSPRRAVDALLHAHALPADALGTNRSLTLPGISVSIGDMVDGLGRVAGKRSPRRINWQPDPTSRRSSPAGPTASTARAAPGLRHRPSIDEIVQAHIDDQLGGRIG